MRQALKKTLPKAVPEPYSGFGQIDGRHEWQTLAPTAFVFYQVRILRKSKIVFFNFPLAKEMGLLPKDHPEKLNPELQKKLIETFALRIINEYDLQKKIRYPKADVKVHPYMATRYLQLQHGSRRGTTSGDGRGIWNGSFQDNGIRWDLSSCGTGATGLSPGAVSLGMPIKTGDKKICYGNGLADIDEGLSAAILSEVLHTRGLSTERTLLVLEAPGKSAINVRAAPTLLRPSHVFRLHRLRKKTELQGAMSLFQKRIQQSGTLLPQKSLSRYFANAYARFAARMESEYVFCWLAWDGDNMLLNGGIIDYGSVRQFGAFHHKYRYDDVDRWSTRLTEQRVEARNLVASLWRISKDLDWERDPLSVCLTNFDQAFAAEKESLLFWKLGFTEHQIEHIKRHAPRTWKSFQSSLRHIERRIDPKGETEVPDGVNQAPLFSILPLFVGLPQNLLRHKLEFRIDELWNLCLTPTGEKRLRHKPKALWLSFQSLCRHYLDLTKVIAHNTKIERKILELSMRASSRQGAPRITGDAVIHIVEQLLKYKKRLATKEFQTLLGQLISDFTASAHTSTQVALNPRLKRMRAQLLRTAENHKFSI